MPSIARVLFVASFLALTGFSPTTTTALASPLQASSPLIHANSPSSLVAARVVGKHTDIELVARLPISSPTVSALQQRGSSTNSTYLVHQLQVHHDKMKLNADKMHKYAAQKRARSVDDAAFQAGCTTELTDFHNNFGGFYNILCLLNEIAVCCPNIGVGKGRDCYDDSSVTEQLLKDVVDYTKVTLTATRTLVAGIPVLGPLLDPIVEDIKCIVDYLLDLTEDLVDCLINITNELLRPLLASLSPLLTSLLGPLAPLVAPVLALLGPECTKDKPCVL
ncbi:hypothetical protein B0H14DRAFT_3852781 [Mycena olivaceomarginata]|nr:hypothetical protein B0H14DRAFT_3852781 [Mycena olivaceomarginata]